MKKGLFWRLPAIGATQTGSYGNGYLPEKLQQVVENSNSTTPAETASSPPRDLHAVADIRFVIHELGKLTSKVDRLVEDTNKNTITTTNDTNKIAAFQTTAVVLGGQ